MEKEIELNNNEKKKSKTFNSTQDTPKNSNIEKNDCKILKVK